MVFFDRKVLTNILQKSKIAVVVRLLGKDDDLI